MGSVLKSTSSSESSFVLLDSVCVVIAVGSVVLLVILVGTGNWVFFCILCLWSILLLLGKSLLADSGLIMSFESSCWGLLFCGTLGDDPEVAMMSDEESFLSFCCRFGTDLLANDNNICGSLESVFAAASAPSPLGLSFSVEIVEVGEEVTFVFVAVVSVEEWFVKIVILELVEIMVLVLLLALSSSASFAASSSSSSCPLGLLIMSPPLTSLLLSGGCVCCFTKWCFFSSTLGRNRFGPKFQADDGTDALRRINE